MYIKSYPEDSVLRRHCDSAAALDLQESMDRGPTDSVLRRHWLQLRRPAEETQPTASAATQPHGQKPVAAAASEPAPRKGFLAWLSRLFGG